MTRITTDHQTSPPQGPLCPRVERWYRCSVRNPPSTGRKLTAVSPATTTPPSDITVDLREHRPPESTQAELHFAIRFEANQLPVSQQDLRQVPVARYEQQLHPVSTPPALQFDKPSVRLRLGESLQAGVQRLSLEHLDHAIAVLESDDLSPDIAVHEARKAMRRVRGLLRLVRDELGPRVYRFENVHLRDTGRLLSEARNAAVAIDTLAAVESRYGNLLVADIFTGAHGALERRRAGIVEHAIGDPERRGELVRALRSARARYAALPLEGTLGRPSTRPSIRDSYRAIAPGLARTYNRGRLRMADAYRSPSDERFHEWRKRVRYHRFQMQTLTDLWPQAIKGIVRAIDALGETLGGDRDLGEFATLVCDDHSLTSGERERDLLVALLEQPRRDLRQRAWTEGLRVYAEPTDRFVERLGAYWEAWRGQPSLNGMRFLN